MPRPPPKSISTPPLLPPLLLLHSTRAAPLAAHAKPALLLALALLAELPLSEQVRAVAPLT
jgi:hypothetical protein